MAISLKNYSIGGDLAKYLKENNISLSDEKCEISYSPRLNCLIFSQNNESLKNYGGTGGGSLQFAENHYLWDTGNYKHVRILHINDDSSLEAEVRCWLNGKALLTQRILLYVKEESRNLSKEYKRYHRFDFIKSIFHGL